MKRSFDGVLDMTRLLYQDRESWLQEVRKKYGGFGERMVTRCATLVGPEVETMDQVEAKTGKTILAILKQAEVESGFLP